MKLYVVISNWDLVDDGYCLEGVFGTRELAEVYILDKNKDYEKDAYGDFKRKAHEDNMFTEYNYMIIKEVELNLTRKEKI